MKKFLLWALAMSGMLSACVTMTDVYFPAQAVEKTADRMIVEIWSQSESPKEKK